MVRRSDDCGMWVQTLVTAEEGGGGREGRSGRLLHLGVGLLLFRTTLGTVIVVFEL